MSQGPLRYDAVLFDVGGTLVGFTDWAPFQLFLRESGLPAGDKEGHELHQRFLGVVRAEREKALGLGAEQEALDAFWRDVFSLVWPDRPRLAETMYCWFRQDRFDRVMSDAVPVLDALRALGLRLGVISNFTADLERFLSRLELAQHFEFAITSALVGVAKPDARIFDLAVSRLGRLRDRLLYVGDHWGDDIQGARGAGLDGVLVDRGFRQTDVACPRISSLLDLTRYVHTPTRPARAILFDLDGVVLDSTAAHLHAWQQTLAPLGINMTLDDLCPLEGMPTEPMAQQLTERLLGQACSPEEARALARTKRALFLEHLQPRPIPGVVQLLHDLRGRGYRLALVTGNARSAVSLIMPILGVAELFQEVVTADDVVLGKPHPEPYQTAATRLGVASEACLAVENAPLGVESAKAAGMVCAALETTLPASQLAAADRVFPDVAELSDWLLSHWRQVEQNP